jgi:hypothetical protein
MWMGGKTRRSGASATLTSTLCLPQRALEGLKEGNPSGGSEGALEGVLTHSLAGLRAPRASMFLDVATILHGQPLGRVMAVWRAWHGPAARTFYDDLVRRSLLGADARGRLVMHDVLVVLGRGFVLQRTPGFEEHFGSRLWTEGGRVVGCAQVRGGRTPMFEGRVVFVLADECWPLGIRHSSHCAPVASLVCNCCVLDGTSTPAWGACPPTPIQHHCRCWRRICCLHTGTINALNLRQTSQPQCSGIKYYISSLRQYIQSNNSPKN